MTMRTAGPLGAPTREDLLRWRQMLYAKEIAPKGFSFAEAIAWIDSELARLEPQAVAVVDHTIRAGVPRETHELAV